MILRVAGALALMCAAACSTKERVPGAGDRDTLTQATDSVARPPAPGPRTPVILFLGTSLTAGYGLSDPSLAYPALIQAKLDSAGRAYRAVNAGVSGESSAGALDRIDWLLQRDRVAVLVIETGANDGLRGQDPDSVRTRIQRLIDRARSVANPPRLVIAGMEALPNLGPEYVRRFHAIYPALAKANGAALIPFLLEGVAGVDSLNQDDGIHPTAAGQRLVASTVWKALEPLTRR